MTTRRLKITIFLLFLLSFGMFLQSLIPSQASGAPFLEIETASTTNIILVWTNQCILQTSTNLTKWTDLRNATPPHPETPTNRTSFYRLRLADYTLFNDLQSTITSLIDYSGNHIHAWTNDFRPGASAYLQPDGTIIFTGKLNNPDFSRGGAGGRIEKQDWQGEPLWSFDYSAPGYCQHHDIEALPNGNILLIAWESISSEIAIANGRNPSYIDSSGEIWTDTIVECTTDGTIVWKWSAMDHLVQDFDPGKLNYNIISNHPGLIDFNYPYRDRDDWLHMNSISYNEGLDQILVSVNAFSEIWVIDHSTTTEQAAGHNGGNSGKGGDLLYRWGNPEAYGRGSPEDRIFGKQHDAHWIEQGLSGEGNILLFNNGQHRGYSSADEITPPLQPDGSYSFQSDGTYGPAYLSWTYEGVPPSDIFYSSALSNAQRLPNGNTLICEGPNKYIFEVTPYGEVIWDFNAPTAGGIFRATRHFLTVPE